jgi:hypothetical protein
MKLKYIMSVFILAMFIPAMSGAQVNVNAKWVLGNLVYHASDNQMEWLDGVGQSLVVFKDDFNYFDGDSLGNHALSTSKWMWYHDSGTVYPPLVTDTTGILRLDYGAADNDSVVVRAGSEFVKCDTIGGYPISMKMRFYLGDTTQSEFKFGLMEENCVIGHSAGNGIYLQKLDGVNEMSLFCARGGTVDSVVAISNVAVNTWYEVVVFCDGLGGVYGFVNGTALTKISRYVPRTARLTPLMIAKNGETSVSHKYAYFDQFDVVLVKP